VQHLPDKGLKTAKEHQSIGSKMQEKQEFFESAHWHSSAYNTTANKNHSFG
jgi:hypothetical protein